MPRLTPEAVVSEVCKEFAIDKEAVIKKGMKRNKARDMAIYRLSGNNPILKFGTRPEGGRRIVILRRPITQ